MLYVKSESLLKMDFSHLQKLGDYDYTMTVSVFFFLSFDRASKSRLFMGLQDI